VLCHNIRGINSQGTIICWKGSIFQGIVIFENSNAQSVEFISKVSGQSWILTNVYGPCTPDGKVDFFRWFKNTSMLDEQPWLIASDFNLIRHPENRNKSGGDNNFMMAFNEAISKLGVIEISLSGQEFTWSNKQQQPLLERLDWFFINQAWSLQYPETGAKTMTKDISDHATCAISIKTEVPRARVFRFENFWMKHKEFKDAFLEAWNTHHHRIDPAMRITAKLKIARKHLKGWQKGFPKLD
jgi:hypothetical protein